MARHYYPDLAPQGRPGFHKGSQRIDENNKRFDRFLATQRTEYDFF
jgi:hypothetical protein